MRRDIEVLRRWCKREAKRMKRKEDAAIFHEGAELFRVLYRGEAMAFNSVVSRLDVLLETKTTS